jgi:hypothetical protein
MTDSPVPPLAPKVPPGPPKDPPAIPNPNTNGSYAAGIVTNAPDADGKEREANGETEDDGKDYGEWQRRKPESGANNLWAEAEGLTYNPDTDTVGEIALGQSHRKRPPRTHVPISGPDTEDIGKAEAKGRLFPSPQSP